MSNPRVSFANPRRAVIDFLEGKIAEPVGAEFPSVAPAVQVAWDGTPSVVYPVTQRASVRVTAWADGPTAAEALADKCVGFLATHPGDASVWGVQVLTGILPGFDDASGRHFASATFRVSTKPTTL